MLRWRWWQLGMHNKLMRLSLSHNFLGMLHSANYWAGCGQMQLSGRPPEKHVNSPLSWECPGKGNQLDSVMVWVLGCLGDKGHLAARLSESRSRTGRVHTVWSVLFDSTSCHPVIEGHNTPQGIMSPIPSMWHGPLGPYFGIGKADVARAGICCGVDKVSRALGFF